MVLINGISFTSTSTLIANKWSYIVFTYDNASDSVKILINTGALISYVNNSVGSINSNSDSLYIGGIPGITNDLNGYIDEVRISNYAKNLSEFQSNMFKSIDASIDPNNSTFDVSYGLNGCLLDNTEDLGPKLFFRNNARFSHPAGIPNQPESPVNRNVSNNFTNGFYINFVSQNIPLSGTSGTLSNSNFVNLNSTVITDINLFVALNHTNSSNLEIVLKGPKNDSVKVFDNKISNSEDNNIITMFDDHADSSLIDGRYSSFYIQIKPENSLNSVFSGDNPNGLWTLIVRDVAAGDIGILYSWGIQINNQTIRQKDLDCSVYYQGFYSETLNRMTVGDTVKAFLRNFNSPYSIIDSSVAFTSFNGICPLSFANASDNVPYYLVLNHRNTIETWSSTSVKFNNSEANFIFKTDSSSAFGNNMKLVDTSPVRYGLFSGDVNKDGTIDVTDVVNILMPQIILYQDM